MRRGGVGDGYAEGVSGPCNYVRTTIHTDDCVDGESPHLGSYGRTPAPEAHPLACQWGQLAVTDSQTKVGRACWPASRISCPPREQSLPTRLLSPAHPNQQLSWSP